MKYTIAYSCTAHEHIESIDGLYRNIVKFHAGFDVVLIVHCEEPLYKLKDTIPANPNIIFNPIRYKKERFSASIFLAHLDNYEYAVKCGIDFDFFCTISSNNMFVRRVDLNDIKKETPTLLPAPTGTGYSLGNKEMWMWDEFVKNKELAEVLKKHNLPVKIAPHPGTYYRKEVIDFIYSFCKDNNIKKEIFTNDIFGAEEVMFPTLENYATGRVSKRYAVCLYNTNEKDIISVATTGTCRAHSQKHYTMVRVNRNPETPLRKMIDGFSLPALRIAVIIYHKNVKRYPPQWISKCVESIQNQTYKKFDVFELDYGNDGTQIYPKSIFDSKELTTHADAHNFLLDKAFFWGYDYVFNVNVDDYYDPTRFEKQLAYAEQGYDVISSNFYFVDENNNQISYMQGHDKNIMEEANKGINIIAHPVLCYSKHFWTTCSRLIPSQIPIDDFELWKRSYESGKYKFIILPDYLLYYRIHNSKVSKSEIDNKETAEIHSWKSSEPISSWSDEKKLVHDLARDERLKKD